MAMVVASAAQGNGQALEVVQETREIENEDRGVARGFNIPQVEVPVLFPGIFGSISYSHV